MASVPRPTMTAPGYRPASANEDLIKAILLAGVSRVSAYVAYAHPTMDWWCAEVTVPTERPRAVRISRKVLDDGETDWSLLAEELRVAAGARFQDPSGCVASVEWDAARKARFRILLGRPYSEDLRG